jgi:hypothetical protein
MKKTYNIDSITNELEGASLFFSKPATPLPSNEAKKIDITVPKSTTSEQTEERGREVRTKRDNKPRPLTQSKRETNAFLKESKHASNQPFTQETIIETIRKAVKDVGKDSATYRFTAEEKIQKIIIDLRIFFGVCWLLQSPVLCNKT